MKRFVKIIRTSWGIEGFEHPKNWEAIIDQTKKSGFDGLEVALIGFRFSKIDASEYPRLTKLIKQYEMDLICQIHTCDYPESPSNSVETHLKSFHQQIQEAKILEPNLINSHSGRDSWSFNNASKFFNGALAVEKLENVAVCHETHRQRILYNPWITKRLLKAHPIHINADLSHWVCVAERIFEKDTDPEFEGILDQIASRTLLIHSRVGYPQGPQVNDPRAPENKPNLDAHEKWWKKIIDAQRKSSLKTIYIEPEFGPSPYLQSHPFTQLPVAKLEEICKWMRDRHYEMFN